jgi:pilus assembly protein FimV
MLSKRLTIRTLALPLFAAALCGAPRAAELGEIKVNSHIGQQLSADIELVDLTAADLADIQARLANPDVFKGANVAMPPALGGLYISIAKRDNKRFLHLTTLQPVNAEALHLFLELNSGGRQIIRAASLWLTPEPPGQRPVTVAAMPAAEPVPLAAAVAKPTAPAPAAVSPPSQANSEAGLNEAAQRAFAHRQQVAMAKAREQSLNPPPQPAPATAPKPELDRAPEPAPSARKVTPKPAAAAATASVPAVAPAPSAVAPSCAPAKQVEAQLRQCEAMTSKLADIEGKVQRLQIAAAAPAAAAATSAPAPAVAAPKAEAAPAKPGAAPAKPAATPVKPGVAADLAANPRSRMMMIAGGVLAGLAALGGAIYFMRKRQAKGPLKIWQSFRKKGNAEDDVPTLEDAVEVAAH